MTATTMLEAALHLAELGYHVLPLHIVESEQCSCLDSDCRTPGKHPNSRLCPSGHLDATTDAVVISQWWALYPDANIGVALKASGLVDVAPDCPERLEDFQRRGLPATTTVQSGGGAGHQHHFYRRPANCPTLRICKSQDFDLLSDGYAVAPPSVTSGPYVVLTELLAVDDLPEAPAWAVAFMMNEQQRKDARPEFDAGDDDEPPVRLSAEARKRWDGVYFTAKGAGQVDRSTSLYIIAKDLARAGAMPRTIARALLERDATLGWKKYASRTNGAMRALKDAVKAITEVAAEPTFTNDTRDDAGTSADLTACQDNVAALRRQLLAARAQNDQLQARAEYLETRLSRVMTVLYNPGLKPAEALIALNMVNVLDEKAATGHAGDDGFTHVYLDDLTKPTHTYVDPSTGEIIETRKYQRDMEKLDNGSRSVSKATASRYLEKFESWGLIERKPVTKFDGLAGPITELHLRLSATATETVDRLATIEPEREARHGGSKPKAERTPRPFECPEHPTADVVIKRTAECAECRAPLGTLPDELLAADPPFQDETVGDTPSSVARSNVPMVDNLKRDVATTPFRDETQQPQCPNCQRTMVDAAAIALGHCDYQCDLRATPPPPPPPPKTMWRMPTAAFVSGGGE